MNQVETAVGSGLRLTCSRAELVEKLAVVSRAVSMRPTVQILSGIWLQASDGNLELAATDMELSLRSSLDAEIAEPGTVVVPGRLFVEIARLLPADEVEIAHSPEEGRVSVVSGSASYSLHTHSAEDFPRLPEVDAAQTFGVPREALLETITRVGRSASRDESRPVLTGVLVRFGEGKLVMAATDSYRLAVKETAIEGQVPELEAIVPARALTELARIAGAQGTIDLGVHENHVVFRAGDVLLTTRRIDGQFPDYRQLIPEQFEHQVKLARGELLDVVRRIAVMAQRNLPLRLRFAEGELTVSVQAQDLGEARETMPAPFAGEALEIGFNAEFLRDGIESVEADEIELKLISPLRPGLIRSEEDDFQYLIMPIRLAG
ncbi:MAG: DNA polymerase III subunit beta [Actinobacteria bacterium]|nr:DNA polymerase III subunit beta [Actinomycetota bacterium]